MINETKQDKFKRLAKQRGDRILKDLELLGNLSNHNNYDYTETDVKNLISTIEEQFRRIKMRYSIYKKREIEFL